ncbi:MAG: thioesterase family protein [Actinomycetota bacterium]|nr:thioesterase family protein [Actinomycetota bacterium]
MSGASPTDGFAEADPRRDRIAGAYGLRYEEVPAPRTEHHRTEPLLVHQVTPHALPIALENDQPDPSRSAASAAMPSKLGASRLEGQLTPGYHVVADNGALDIGALIGTSDILGGVASGLAVMPAWVVTTNLVVRIDRTSIAGPLHATATVLHTAERTAVARVQFTAGDEATRATSVAEALVTSAVRRAEGLDLGFGRPLRHDLWAPPPVEPVPDWFALSQIGPTTTRLDLLPHLRNPWGILHGGAMSVLVDRAARHAATSGRPHRTVGGAPGLPSSRSVMVQFLAPVGVGPVEARCQVLGAGATGTVIRIEVHDIGADDLVVALATVVVAPS